MKGRIIGGIFCFLLLTGCGQQNENRMTQEITTNQLEEKNDHSDKKEKLSSEKIGIETDFFGEEEKIYLKAKAERDAISIDLDNLKATFRIGNITETELKEKQLELKNLDQQLDQEEDQWEDLFEQNHKQTSLPTGTLEELLKQLQEAEEEENTIQLEEKRLKLRYQSGEITREDFISKQIEIILKEEENDSLKDAIEEALEIRGWDD